MKKKWSLKEILIKHPELKENEAISRFDWYLLKNVNIHAVDVGEEDRDELEIVVLGYVRGGKYQVVSGHEQVLTHQEELKLSVLAYVPIYHANTKKKS